MFTASETGKEEDDDEDERDGDWRLRGELWLEWRYSGAWDDEWW